MSRKIAIISEHASPLENELGGVDSGGQNVYVAQVARKLAAMGYLVDVFTRRDHRNLPKVIEWGKNIRVINVPAGPARYVPKEELLPYMDKFTRYMVEFIQAQGEPYDLVHANFWMSGLVAADLKKILYIPFVITFHALGRVRRLYQGKEDGFPDVRFEIEDRIVAEADAIIAECPQDEQDLVGLYRADISKISIIPCGFNPDEVWKVDKHISREILGIPKDDFVVLQLGRLVPRKGIDNVIKGFAAFAQETHAKALLYIVGGEGKTQDGPSDSEVRRLKALADNEGVRDYVKFPGKCDRRMVKYYFSAADVFVTTPWYEPFGITPLESMACSTPVLGAAVGGIKYSVVHGKTGFLVPPNDPGSLSERLAYLYNHPEHITILGRQGLQRVLLDFTWDKVGISLAKLYEKLIAINQTAVIPRLRQFEIVQSNFQEAASVLRLSQQILTPAVIEAAQVIADCIGRGNKVMICGNGGSAADSQHFAAELVGKFKSASRPAMPAISLTSDPAILTAWANDFGYEDVFARQIEALGNPGDVLVGISTSGLSKNVIQAFNTARQRGVFCLALLGGDGGEVLPLADLALVVPSKETQRAQEIHILLLHMIAGLVEDQIIHQNSLSNSTLSEVNHKWNLDKNTPFTVTFENINRKEWGNGNIER